MNLLAALNDVKIPAPEVQWFALTPMFILIVASFVLMILAVLTPMGKKKSAYALYTCVAAAGSGVVSLVLWFDVKNHGPRTLISGALTLDGFALFFWFLISCAVFVSALLIDDYLRREDLNGCEIYVLMMAAAVGGLVLAAANDLIVLFVGLEVLSIALYVMAAMHAHRPTSQEAAIKYFVLGGFSSAFLLYGIAMTYGGTGSTNLVRIGTVLRDNFSKHPQFIVAGLALMLVGFAFKIAAAPFHAWAPDVYQGSPSPVSGFMASAAKAAAFAGLLRVYVMVFPTLSPDWRPAVWGLAVLTVVVGSFLAIVQTDVKRTLAYSSISHAGFILIGLQANSADGTSGSMFYLLAYTFMVLGSFGCITLIGRAGDDAHSVDDYRGLSKQRPVLAFVFSIFLFAQAGVPLTSGFIAKFGVISAAVKGHSYAVAIVAMLAAVVGAFLYLRIVVMMYVADTEGEARTVETAGRIQLPYGAVIGIGICFVFTLAVGFAPDWALNFARDSAPVLIAIPR